TQEAQAMSPAPPSPPPPSGGGPTSVEVTGAVKTVSGRCPSLAIAIGSRSIVTNADTDFQNLKCTDIKKNVTLRVDGIAQTGTTSSGAFVYQLNPELGTVERSTQSFGPFFVERASTAGRGETSFAVTFQHLRFTSLDGHNLRDGTFVTTANKFRDETAAYDEN